MQPQPSSQRKIEMRKFREIAEQHREKGRFKPTVPRMVPNTPVVSPRPTSDSADVKLREASAAAIAAATAISKKKSGNYDKEGMRVKPYKNPDHPNRKSNEQRRKEMNEYVQQQDPAELRGTSSGAMSLLDKPNKEPMKKYKDLKQIAELSTDLLHRYKEKAAADASKADKEGDFARGNKRFSGVVKATNKQFANFKKKGFKEETEMNEAKDEREYDYEGDMAKTQLKTIIRNAQKIHDMIEDDENMPEWVQSKITLAKDYIVVAANYLESEMSEQTNQGATKEKETKFHTKLDKLVHSTFGKSPTEMKKEEVELDEVSSTLVGKARDAAFSKGKENQAFRFVRKHYEKQKKESDAFGKKMAEDVEQIDEKNVPTSPEKWAQAKAQAKAKFDVYPSAYANGWAAKKYKEMGGGWKSVSESKEDLPFTPDAPKKKSIVVGKKPAGYSTARHLARQAMQKQVEKMKKKPIKEESKTAKLVRGMMKKKTSEDAFQKDPEMSNTITKNV